MATDEAFIVLTEQMPPNTGDALIGLNGDNMKRIVNSYPGLEKCIVTDDDRLVLIGQATAQQPAVDMARVLVASCSEPSHRVKGFTQTFSLIVFAPPTTSCLALVAASTEA
ncbi:Aste57867_3973 [Aphanomyces stellatus]|uniref:Aste57867_3973 protein n=1 Tax=Aphanomyces stellatus TaxID=120398 RepID=A0A485KBY4_9STRA|nr:hypothetical protein As57867_003962 [Aphanomyces stellatus]VFT81110.1 Aste57867_3973 [Aphanomyces stellatus]